MGGSDQRPSDGLVIPFSLTLLHSGVLVPCTPKQKQKYSD